VIARREVIILGIISWRVTAVWGLMRTLNMTMKPAATRAMIIKRYVALREAVHKA